MFWTSENAESILQVRSQVIPGQWDGVMKDLGEFRRTTACDGYAWQPRPMSGKSEDSYNTAI